MSKFGRQRGVAFVAVLTAAVAAACGDDGNGAPGTSSARGGSAGSAGTGGATTPRGGSGGTDSGGEAGATSQGGDAAGGMAGASGGEGGSAGDGGAGGEDPTVVLLRTLSPLPEVPPDPTNAVADDPVAAALGQRFFFDEEFSGPLRIDSDLGSVDQTGRVSCKSCHGSPLMDDDRSDPPTVAIGAGLHTRNSPPLVNASFYPWTNWGGRFAAQWELPLAVVESGVIMNGNRLALAHRIFDAYKEDYEAVFGPLPPELGTDFDRFPAAGKPKAAPEDLDGAWEGMDPDDQVIVNTILVNYSKAVAAYLRLLVSRNAPLDRFVAGESDALSEAAWRGAQLFVGKAQCRNCHNGPHLSDGEFHVLGVPQTGPNVPASDDGRFKDLPGLLNSLFNVDGSYSDDPDTGKLDDLVLPPGEALRGAFRTPSLRGVALTAPYMHSGQFATLEEVIDFYDAGGSEATPEGVLHPLGLTAGEKADLTAFLEALTGEGLPPALLTDTSAP